jgi:hypothetical protein
MLALRTAAGLPLRTKALLAQDLKTQRTRRRPRTAQDFPRHLVDVVLGADPLQTTQFSHR